MGEDSKTELKRINVVLTSGKLLKTVNSRLMSSRNYRISFVFVCVIYGTIIRVIGVHSCETKVVFISVIVCFRQANLTDVLHRKGHACGSCDEQIL